MKGTLYCTKIKKSKEEKNIAHRTGEELLAWGLRREYNKELAFEPRSTGSHGKPFFTLLPEIHYNISHSGDYAVCLLAEKEVGVDIQEHKEVNCEKLLKRMADQQTVQEILDSENRKERFFQEWALREAYIKWTGEGLSRDLRTILMDEGWHTLVELAPGYSAAVWAAEPVELRVEWTELSE